MEKHFHDEIAIYQEKLSKLPGELYAMWQETQREMGLNQPVPPSMFIDFTHAIICKA
jgi:hypothetical protein